MKDSINESANDSINDKPVNSDMLISVYNHYQALALNEHSQINQRLMHSFLGNTFLFGGFISSFSVANDNLLLPIMLRIRFWLPISAISFSFIYAVLFIMPTIKALKVWSLHLEDLEKNYFDKYLGELCMPYKARVKFKNISNWPFYIGFPAQLFFFIILWGMALGFL